MDSKYDKFFEKAIERNNAGALVEVVGCLQEAIQTVIADGGKPNNSISCIDLIEANMGYIIHNFRREWTRAQKLGAKWELQDGIAGRTKAYRAFLHEWHGLLESDMHMVDYIERQIGMPRANYPGVYSTFTVVFRESKNTLTFIVRGRPITPDMYDRIHLRADHIIAGEKHIPEIQKQIEQFLRGEGFEVIELLAPRPTPMVI